MISFLLDALPESALSIKHENCGDLSRTDKERALEKLDDAAKLLVEKRVHCWSYPSQSTNFYNANIGIGTTILISICVVAFSVFFKKYRTSTLSCTRNNSLGNESNGFILKGTLLPRAF